MADSPQPPHELVARVIRIAQRDGVVVLAIAGFFAVLSAAFGDVRGALIGVAVAGAGVFELHGATLLKASQSNGVRWLVASQLYLLFVILCYVLWRIQSYDPVAVREYIKTSGMAQQAMLQNGIPESDLNAMFRIVWIGAYVLVAILTAAYQGGMAFYYHRKSKPVREALLADPM